MVEPHPIPKHPAFKDITGKTMASGVHVLYFLGRKQWLARCLCGREFEAGGKALIDGLTIRCPECRSPSVKPETQECQGCHLVLPFNLEHFGACNQMPFGLKVRCRECLRPIINQTAKEYARALHIQVLQHYSKSLIPFCSCCGENILDFLTIDHIQGGGKKHREQSRLSHIDRIIKRDGFPEGLRVLCMNCNFSLGKFGYCPHGMKSEVATEIATQPKLIIPEIITGTSQQCFKCLRVFPLTQEFFYRHPQMSNGFLGKCRDCAKTDSIAHGKPYRQTLKLEALRHYSGGDPKCQCCGETHLEFLSIDHIDGGGRQHKFQIKGRSLHGWLKRNGFPLGYAVLCMSCNHAKGHYGCCPHTSL